MRSSVYFLSILFGMCLALGVRGNDDEDCEECTFEADSSIQSVSELLAKSVPLTVNEVKPCKACKIWGIENFLRRDNMPVCSHKESDGSQSHDFNVIFKNVSIDCECELSTNPADVAKALTSAQAAAPPNCSPAAAADGLSSLENSKASMTPKLTDLMNMKECMPATPKVGAKSIGGGASGKGKISIGRRAAVPQTVTGKLLAYWTGVLVFFSSKVPADSEMVAIRNVGILNKDYKDVRASCTGGPGFPEACDCLVAGKFPVFIISQAIQMLVQCQVDEGTKKHNEIVDYFKCSNA